MSELRKLDPAKLERRLAAYLAGTGSVSRDELDPSVTYLRALRDNVAGQFQLREDCVRAVVAALMAGVPVTLLGEPGTAKSAIVRAIARECRVESFVSADGKRMESGYFEYLVTPFTMPEELFGTVNINALKTGKYERVITGMLPEAQLVFLDELFRGGSHILNTLLSILHEHRFHDGQKVHDVPLVGVVAASNNPPDDPQLAAFFDRFPIRVWVDSVSQAVRREGQEERDQAYAELMRKAHELDLQHYQHAYAVAPERSGDDFPVLNDFRIAQTLVRDEARQIGQGAADREKQYRQAFEDVSDRFAATQGVGSTLSDRSFYTLRKFAIALGLLDDEDESMAHIEVFRYVAGRPEHREVVEQYVRERLHPPGHGGHR